MFGCVLPFALSWQPLDIHDTPFARPRAFVVSHFVRVDVRNGQINAGGVVWCLHRRCWRSACVGCCGCGAWCLVPLVWLLMCRRLCSVRGIWRRCRVAGRAGSAGSASFFKSFFCPLSRPSSQFSFVLCSLLKRNPASAAGVGGRTTEQKALTITRASTFVVRWRSVFRRHVGTFRRVQEHHPLPMYRHIDRATSDVQVHEPLSADVQAATLMSLCALLACP